MAAAAAEPFRCRPAPAPAMASHFTYIHELRELIASSTTASAGSAPGSAHLEVKLREVLPNLLRDYVIPSPKGSCAAPPSLHIRL